MNATIYSVHGDKHVTFTKPTDVPNTNNANWFGTSNSMDDYYGEVVTDDETSVTFFNEINFIGNSYVVKPGSNLPSLKAVFPYKVGSFIVSNSSPTPI